MKLPPNLCLCMFVSVCVCVETLQARGLEGGITGGCEVVDRM